MARLITAASRMTQKLLKQKQKPSKSIQKPRLDHVSLHSLQADAAVRLLLAQPPRMDFQAVIKSAASTASPKTKSGEPRPRGVPRGRRVRNQDPGGCREAVASAIRAVAQALPWVLVLIWSSGRLR